MAEWCCRKREEEYALLAKAHSEPKLTYYGTGAVVAIGVLDVIDYYVYQSKIHEETLVHQINETPVQRPKEIPAHKFEME